MEPDWILRSDCFHVGGYLLEFGSTFAVFRNGGICSFLKVNFKEWLKRFERSNYYEDVVKKFIRNLKGFIVSGS